MLITQVVASVAVETAMSQIGSRRGLMVMERSDRVARSNGTEAATPPPRPSHAGKMASRADSRLGLAKASRPFVRKVFPEHWSFMFGEIALRSFVVLLVSGVFLSLWFEPSMAEVPYQGS